MPNPSTRIAHLLAALVVLVLVTGGALAPLGLDITAPRIAWAAPLTVTSTADSGAGSLRQALADATAGDTIAFSVPASSTITLASTLAVATQLTIDGSGAAGLSVNGNNAVRVFSSSAPLTLLGLRIINGRVSGAGLAGVGGGLSATNALTLTNVTFFDNTAISGGLAALAGGVIARNTQFSGAYFRPIAPAVKAALCL